MPCHISVENQLPEDLHRAMSAFIDEHPQWDQYRLVQAAIAGFLFQRGCKERAVVHHYLSGLFRKQALTPDGLHSEKPRTGGTAEALGPLLAASKGWEQGAG